MTIRAIVSVTVLDGDFVAVQPLAMQDRLLLCFKRPTGRDLCAVSLRPEVWEGSVESLTASFRRQLEDALARSRPPTVSADSLVPVKSERLVVTYREEDPVQSGMWQTRTTPLTYESKEALESAIMAAAEMALVHFRDGTGTGLFQVGELRLDIADIFASAESNRAVNWPIVQSLEEWFQQPPTKSG